MLVSVHFWDFSSAVHHTFDQLSLKSALRCESLDRLEEDCVVFEVIERIIKDLFTGALAALTVAVVIQAPLLGHQCLLLWREEAAEEIAQVDRVLDDPPDVELASVEICQALNRAMASVFAEEAECDVEDHVSAADAHRIQSSDGNFQILSIW